MSDKSAIEAILKQFIGTASSIQATAVMSRDGLLIASQLSEGVDGERLSAISASLLSLADRAVKDLNKGDLTQVLIFGTDGFVLMLKVGDKAVFSVVSKNNSRLGMLLHEAKKSAIILAGHI